MGSKGARARGRIIGYIVRSKLLDALLPASHAHTLRNPSLSLLLFTPIGR